MNSEIAPRIGAVVRTPGGRPVGGSASATGRELPPPGDQECAGRPTLQCEKHRRIPRSLGGRPEGRAGRRGRGGRTRPRVEADRRTERHRVAKLLPGYSGRWDRSTQVHAQTGRRPRLGTDDWRSRLNKTTHNRKGSAGPCLSPSTFLPACETGSRPCGQSVRHVLRRRRGPPKPSIKGHRAGRYQARVATCNVAARAAKPCQILPSCSSVAGPRGVPVVTWPAVAPKFIGQLPWDHRPVLAILAQNVGQSIGEPDGMIVFDQSGFAKKRSKSVGVARQWCGRPGKLEDCQIGIYLGYVSRCDHALVDFRLYLPNEWAQDRKPCREAGVPRTVRFQTRHD
jgi:DDE superfamily endonuclease